MRLATSGTSSGYTGGNRPDPDPDLRFFVRPDAALSGPPVMSGGFIETEGHRFTVSVPPAPIQAGMNQLYRLTTTAT